MKTPDLHSSRGSAFVTAILFCMILMVLVGSILNYSLTERRLNAREALRLEARNAAEAVSEYGMGQVKQIMDNRSTFATTAFTSGAETVARPPGSFLSGSRVANDTTELVVGLIVPKTTGSSALYYFDPADPSNEFEPLKGLYAMRLDVRILSKATATPSWGNPHTVHMSQTLSARASPLFSHAIFYNMDLEIWPGPTMNILGTVHTNGRLYIKKQSSNGTYLSFLNKVTAAKGVYAIGTKIAWKTRTGATSDLSEYSDTVRFVNNANNLISIKDTGTGIWRDQKMGAGSETDTTRTAFRNFASNTYQGNLQTEVHSVPTYNPAAMGDYVEDTTPGDGTDQSVNEGRKLIERPLASGEAGYNAQVEAQKYSTRSGIYIVANPTTTDRVGHKPDGSTVNVKAGSYRAFKRDGTEIILPGQATYGDNNATANAGTNLAGDPVVKIKSDRMTDLRRTNTFNPAAGRSASNDYDPKVIDLIELDMTALKKAVDRTVNGASSSSVYRTATPADGSTGSGEWSSYINNPAATPASITVTAAHAITNFNATDWNGGIYIESIDAETRRDSGVRIANGRGRIATAADNSGLAIATNDALYVLGHFNADGTIDTATTGTTNSGRYPESSEVPAAIAADAITILSQPVLDKTGSGSSFAITGQSEGWNDNFSANRGENDSSWSSSWATSNPSSSNTLEGSNASLKPFRDPDGDATTTIAVASSRDYKLPASNTEISAAMLTGIVPSNKNNNGAASGGAHNFPRFLEDWATTSKTCAIRGSMVAMFESRVATEPWSLRVYQAPTRLWGFNELFAQGSFPPLTPRVMSYRRVDFNDITAAEYAATKTAWGL